MASIWNFVLPQEAQALPQPKTQGLSPFLARNEMMGLPPATQAIMAPEPTSPSSSMQMEVRSRRPAQSASSQKPMSMDPEQEIEQMYLQGIEERKRKQAELEAESSNLQAPSSLEKINLQPLMALADSWNGTNMAGSIRPSTAQQDFEAKKNALKGLAMKNKEGITEDQLAYLKLQAERKKNEELAELRRLGLNDRQGKAGNTLATKLRDQWDKHDISKSYRNLESAINRIESSDSNDAPGDMSMIFAFMKMLDENSTVRESEYAQAEKARGLMDTMNQWLIKAQSGEKLNPQQRAQFKAVARNIFGDVARRKAQFDQDYRFIAQESGVDPDLVVYTGREGRTQSSTPSLSSPQDPMAAFKAWKAQKGNN
jgi:hypothetical protein